MRLAVFVTCRTRLFAELLSGSIWGALGCFLLERFGLLPARALWVASCSSALSCFLLERFELLPARAL